MESNLVEDAAARLGWPLHTVEDAGHLPHVDHPDAFLDALGAALDPTRQRTSREGQE